MSELTNVSLTVRVSLAAVLADLAEIVHADSSTRLVGPQLRALVKEALREETYVVPVPLLAYHYGQAS